MLSQAITGPAASGGVADGSTLNLRLGKMGDLIKSDLQPRLYEANYRKMLFSASVQAAGVTSVGLTTTYVGIALSNPTGNTQNLVVTSVGYAFPVAPAAVIILGLMTGYNSGANVTHTVALTPQSNLIGVGPAPSGKVDSSATLTGTPVIERVLGTIDTGAITVDRSAAVTNVPLEGSIVLPPGAWVAVYTSTAANTAGFLGSIQWMEVPV
jgi:hypothetical protein